MFTRGLPFAAVLCPLCAFAQPLSLQVSETGVVSVSDGKPLLRAVIAMHSPGWQAASVERGATGRREGNRVTGAIALPANCTGELRYAATGQENEGGADLTYELSFTDSNEILGAYVSFMLPTARFEGKPISLLHDGGEGILPKEGESGAPEGHACAAVVDLDDESSLVIAGNASCRVKVQDNRQYGSANYELRFHLFDEGRVFPGLVAERRFRIAAVPREETTALVKAMNPKRTVDPSKPYALVQDNGNVRVGTRDNQLLEAYLAIHGVGWTYTTQTTAEVQSSGDDANRSFVGKLPVPAAEATAMEFEQTASDEGGALGLRYRLRFPEAVKLNGYQVSFPVGLDDYAGAQVELATQEGTQVVEIPAKHEENTLFAGPVTRLAIAPGEPHGFVLDVDQPSALLIQDNRGWGGDTVELRFNFRRGETGEQVPAGETVERAFTFRLNSPLQIVLDESGATSETDTADWIPFTLPWDSAPVDVSFLNHKPAGKFGFVQAKDDKFVLADTGEEIRFWGTCFSAGANFPSHEQAEKIARRLAHFGINIVRTHHADAPWAERHFFKKDVDNTREFDAENLDRFDYLIRCLKREGIYIYLDQLVNRYFKTGDGVDAVADLGACAKPYSNFDPKLIELQKEFSRNLWTHVNPYTGLAYKDDPAIALMEFANENDLFTQQVTLEPYRTRFEAQYRAWAKENGVALPADAIDFRQKTDDMMRFLVEVQRGYYQEMERYLRDEVGVRVPMTGSNWSRNAALLASLQDRQFTDSHAYWNHPSREGNFRNSPMIGSHRTIMDSLGFQRLVGKPFFVSEWDEPWPNEWRAELPCWLAAIAAFQEWNGLTVYTYRHSSSVPVDTISGAFETFNDPARLGLFAHAALMYRRGDVAPAKQKVAVQIDEGVAVSAESPSPWACPAYRGLSHLHRFATALGEAPTGYAQVVARDEQLAASEATCETDTGQVARSLKQKVLKIDSPRSQAISGLLGEAGRQSTADMEVTCQSEFATLALSSLTDEPIRQSDRLLLAAVGRAENTGFKYNLLRNKRIDSGRGPILIDPIRAEVSIRTDGRNLKVQALGADGSTLGDVPAEYRNGRLVFRLGPEYGTMYYELSG